MISFTWDWKVYLGMDTDFFLSHVVIAFVRIKRFSDCIFRSIAINLTCLRPWLCDFFTLVAVVGCIVSPKNMKYLGNLQDLFYMGLKSVSWN